MVGFVLGWAGVDGEGLHVHSHMLAALPERRHRGVGYALKLGQRAQALAQDIHVARWTFDPLVARNAWFNFGKLGAVADAFGRAFYGEMTDEINAGDRSDRLVVRWDLDLDPAPRPWPDGLPAVLSAEGDPQHPRPAQGPTAGSRRSRRGGPSRSRGPQEPGPGPRGTLARGRGRGAGRLLPVGVDRRGLRSDPIGVRADTRGHRVSRVRAIELLLVELPLVRPFRTSFGEMAEKRCILVRVETDGGEGWGECVADTRPDFSGEFNDGAWLVLRDFLAPALVRAGDVDVGSVEESFAAIRGNPMAKAALLDAFVDAELRADGTSLASWLGAERPRVECGVSIGIAPSVDALLAQVDGYLAEGYRRIKLKIEPGTDIERVRAVRAAHPDILLSVDANAAYTPVRHGRVPRDGGSRSPDDRAAAPPRGSAPPRRAPGQPPDGSVSR